jgi:choline kinase
VPLVEHAVIAAAGLGSRLGRGHPKCLLKIQDQSILERQLRLLEGIKDVRLVVGFEEQQVIAAALAIRKDIVFVRNAAYRSTNTLQSYGLGAKGLRDSCLFMDADILFEPASFAAFVAACKAGEPLVAVTAAKTTDAVYAHLEGGHVTRFSRTSPGAFEWANLCWLPPAYCETGDGAVFERMSKDLPLKAHVIESFEIDTPEDHQKALENAAFI